MKKYTGIIVSSITVILSIISIIILPDTAVIRIGLDAQPTATASKFMVPAIAVALALIGALVQFTDKDERSFRGLVLSVASVLVVAMLLWINF